MTAIKKLSKRRAVSPVIATVILVAVAITVAVGVSYWMSGIAGQYTSFEKVEIQTGWSEVDMDLVPANGPVGWIIKLSIKNSGSASSTITHVFVNDVPVILDDPCNDGILGSDNIPAPTNGIALTAIGANIDENGKILEAGDSATIEIYIGIDYGTLSSGTTINIKLHSAGGMDYIRLIKLA